LKTVEDFTEFEQRAAYFNEPAAGRVGLAGAARVLFHLTKGLTYAQVSDLDVKGADWCTIGHGAEGEAAEFQFQTKRSPKRGQGCPAFSLS
jgi:hypothetical protein